jgi:hypothetical protein
MQVCGKYGILVYDPKYSNLYKSIALLPAVAVSVSRHIHGRLCFVSGVIMDETALPHSVIIPLVKQGCDLCCLSSDQEKLYLERTLRKHFGMPCGGKAVYPYSTGLGKPGVFVTENKNSFTNNQWRTL